MDMNSKMIKEKGTNGMERKRYETERVGEKYGEMRDKKSNRSIAKEQCNIAEQSIKGQDRKGTKRDG